MIKIKCIGVVIKFAVASDSLENPFLNKITYAPSLLGPIPNPAKKINIKNFLSKGFSLENTKENNNKD